MKNLFSDIELNQVAEPMADTAEPTVCRAAEVQLSYKRRDYGFPTISSSQAVYAIKDMIYPEGAIDYKEYFFVLLINRAGKPQGWHKVSEGTTAFAPVDIKVIMQAAILANAASILLIHNHPSGSLRPSIEDDKLTKRVKEAAALFDIRVLDHMIFTSEGYYSYMDNGRL